MANFNGTANADTITGTNDDDTIYADHGDDTVYGLDGDDFIYGSLGNDVLDGGRGADYLEGGSGNDTLKAGGGTAGDVLNGGSGNDLMYGSKGADTFYFNGLGAEQDKAWAGNDSAADNFIFQWHDNSKDSKIYGFKAEDDTLTFVDAEDVFVTQLEQKQNGTMVHYETDAGVDHTIWLGTVDAVDLTAADFVGIDTDLVFA